MIAPRDAHEPITREMWVATRRRVPGRGTSRCCDSGRARRRSVHVAAPRGARRPVAARSVRAARRPQPAGSSPSSTRSTCWRRRDRPLSVPRRRRAVRAPVRRAHRRPARRGRALDLPYARIRGGRVDPVPVRQLGREAVREDAAARGARAARPGAAADREHLRRGALPRDRRTPADAALRRGRRDLRAEGARPGRPARDAERRLPARRRRPPDGRREDDDARGVPGLLPPRRSPGSASCPTRSPTGRSGSGSNGARARSRSSGSVAATSPRQPNRSASRSSRSPHITSPTLTYARPHLPDELDDRAQDCWEPLLAIADLAGGDWPARARAAAIALSSGEAREDDSLGARLLQDIYNVFHANGTQRYKTADLIAELATIEESPVGRLVREADHARTRCRSCSSRTGSRPCRSRSTARPSADTRSSSSPTPSIAS